MVSLVTSIVLLQSGFSYYLSFQVLALFLIAGLITVSGPVLVNVRSVFIIIIIFSIFLIIKSSYFSSVVSRNSGNIILTTTGIVSYALMLLLFSNFRFKNVDLILVILQRTTSLIIVVLISLIIINELSLIPGLDSYYFLLQNSSLITNFASIDVLENDLQYRILSGTQPRIDLFYGESSFLAIVLLSCGVSHCITSRILSSKNVLVNTEYRFSIVIIIAIFGLISLHSLSSIIYAFILATLGLRGELLNKLFSSKAVMIFIWLFIILIIGIYSYDTLYHRISTIQDSSSLSQRFGLVLVFGIENYMFGIIDESTIPKVGIHNGLIYLIAISGLGGLCYFIFILYTSIYLSRSIKIRILVCLTLMALAVQNGAMFSPNKMVLYSLILLPLSCIRTINYKDNKS